MPIPLVEVPNAPGMGPTVTQSGVPGVPNIENSAKNLLTPTVQQGQFDAPAQGQQAIASGLQNLGAGGERVAAVISDANERRTRFQDQVTSASYDRMMNEEFAKYKGTLDGVPEDQWLPQWQKIAATKSQEILKQVGQPKTPEGQAQLAVSQQNFMRTSNVDLITSANRSAVQRGTGELMSQAQRQADSGDVEGMHSTVSKLVSNGAWRQDQADTFLKQADDQRVSNNLTAAMSSNPKLFLNDIRDYIKNGDKNPDTGETNPLVGSFDGPDKAIKLKRWENIAAANLHSQQSEQRQNLFEGIQSGAVTNEAQIAAAAKAGGDVLDPEDLQAARKALMNTVGVLDVDKYNDIRSQVAQYNKQGDPDGTQAAGIERQIGAELPTAEGQMLFKQMRGMLTGTAKNTSADSLVNKFSNEAYSGMIFGAYQDDSKTKFLTGQARLDNEQARQKAALAKARFDDEWTKYSAAHPGVSDEEAQKWAYEQVKPLLQTAQGQGWFSWAWGGIKSAVPVMTSGAVKPDGAKPTPPAPSPQDRLKILNGGKTSSLGGEFSGKDGVFDAAASKYGVDPALLKAIAAHETANGTSHALKEYNNPGGLMDANSKDSKGFQRFASVEDGVDAMASLLSRNYIKKGLTDIPSIQRKYAPVGAANDPLAQNGDWVNGVTHYYKKFSS